MAALAGKKVDDASLVAVRRLPQGSGSAWNAKRLYGDWDGCVRAVATGVVEVPWGESSPGLLIRGKL